MLCNSGKIAWEQFTRCLGLHYISCLDLSLGISRRSISGWVIQLSVWEVVFGAQISVETPLLFFRDIIIPQNYLENVVEKLKRGQGLRRAGNQPVNRDRCIMQKRKRGVYA